MRAGGLRRRDLRPGQHFVYGTEKQTGGYVYQVPTATRHNDKLVSPASAFSYPEGHDLDELVTLIGRGVGVPPRRLIAAARALHDYLEQEQ